MLNNENPGISNSNPTLSAIKEVANETEQMLKPPLTRFCAALAHICTITALGAGARWGSQHFAALECRLMNNASNSFSTDDFMSAITTKAHNNPTKNQLWFQSVSDIAVDNGYVWGFAKMEWPAVVTSQVRNYAFQVYRGLKSSVVCVIDVEKKKVLFNEVLPSSAEGMTVAGEEIRFTYNGRSELSSITFPCKTDKGLLYCTITNSGAEIRESKDGQPLFTSENGQPFKPEITSSTPAQAVPVALPT